MFFHPTIFIPAIVSPSKIKISQLSERLNNFGLQLEDDKKVFQKVIFKLL